MLGILNATAPHGREIFSFEYDPAWLASGNAFQLDPALHLFTGPQYPQRDKSNFGMFLDSSPDRWGRLLMDRREALASRTEARPRRKLNESDYLLGVFDGQRMGGLRFRLAPDGPFLDDNEDLASPPWTSLRDLEFATLEIEKEHSETNPSYSGWLRMLIAPGGSLGGARPKAGVVDPEGHLWIAKFPSRNDAYDLGAWEHVAQQLAHGAGINTPAMMSRMFNTQQHTFLSKRFDRTETGRRLHFASAMTMLNRTDGDDASTGESYLELAELIMKQGAHSERDLEELWRRIVFSICVSNVDDHLRNHGFLLEEKGWSLSPVYDINPVPFGSGLKLNISEAENALDLELAREVAPYFQVKRERCAAIIAKVVSAVNQWRAVAVSMGISRREQEYMEPAFRVANAASKA